MSMSSIGLTSRLVGEQFGSAITFASVGKASAPGQIDYQELNQMLDIIHKIFRSLSFLIFIHIIKW